MKLIFIRGLPGTGKTIIAKILKQIFLNAEIICVDKFKLQAMKKGNSFEESQKIAHKKTLEKLNSINKEYIIVEELICDRDFYNELKDFVDRTKSRAYWFRLMRPLDKLLEVEKSRKRKIKNSKEDFDKLKEDIESCKIENEYLIKNDNLALTIRKILEFIEREIVENK